MGSSTANTAYGMAADNELAIKKLEERVARLEELLKQRPSDGIKSATPTGIIGDPV